MPVSEEVNFVKEPGWPVAKELTWFSGPSEWKSKCRIFFLFFFKVAFLIWKCWGLPGFSDWVDRSGLEERCCFFFKKSSRQSTTILWRAGELTQSISEQVPRVIASHKCGGGGGVNADPTATKLPHQLLIASIYILNSGRIRSSRELSYEYTRKLRAGGS